MALARKSPWPTIIAVVGLSLAVGRLLVVASQRREVGAEKQIDRKLVQSDKKADRPAPPAGSPQPKTAHDSIKLTKGSAAADAPQLTADYLPRMKGPATFIDTFLDARTGESLIRNRSVIKPVGDGFEKADYDISTPLPAGVGPLPPIVNAFTYAERDGAIWYDGEPLLYVGAKVGDTWLSSGKPENRFVLEGFRGDGNQEAVIEEIIGNSIPDASGSVTYLRETIVLRKGRGIVSRRCDAVTNGSGYPHPDRMIRRVE